jgi:hypothetical protein
VDISSHTGRGGKRDFQTYKKTEQGKAGNITRKHYKRLFILCTAPAESKTQKNVFRHLLLTVFLMCGLLICEGEPASLISAAAALVATTAQITFPLLSLNRPFAASIPA